MPLSWEDGACLGSCPYSAEGAFRRRIQVVGLRSLGLLKDRGWYLMRAHCLLRQLRVIHVGTGRRLRWGSGGAPRAVRDAGTVVTDLAVAMALGDPDCAPAAPGHLATARPEHAPHNTK